PSARIEIRIFGFVLGIEAAFAFAFDPKLKRNPADADVEFLFELERRIESEICERTFVVRVHLDLSPCHIYPAWADRRQSAVLTQPQQRNEAASRRPPRLSPRTYL